MMKYINAFGLIFLLFCTNIFVIPSHANQFHRVIYHSVDGMFPYINQIEDTGPYGMDGSLSSSPAACLMISAYYGNLEKKANDLSPSGFGSYITTAYEMKKYMFSESTLDAKGNSFAGAHGFLVKDQKMESSPEITSEFLRAHNVLTTFIDGKDKKIDFLRLIQSEISKNQPVFLQYKEHNVVIVGHGYSQDQKDILLVKDPTEPTLKSIYWSKIDAIYLLQTKTVSFADNIKVIHPEIDVREKPTVNSMLVSTKKKGNTGLIKLHPDYSDLWINDKVNSSVQTWFYIQWDDGTKGWSCSGKGIDSYFEPYMKIKEDPEKDKATLTLTIHEETQTGPIVNLVKVYVVDGIGKTYQQSSNNYGQVTIKGTKGKWSIKLSKQDYYDKNWKETIEGITTKDVFILKKPKKEEDLVKPNLICNEIRLRGGTAQEGKEYYINPSVQNIGKTPAEARSHVKVYLSPRRDSNLADDYLLGEAEVSTLKVNEKCIATVFFNQFPFIPLLLGVNFNVWPVIVVDSQNEILESDENNIFVSSTSIRILLERKKGLDSPCSSPPCKMPEILTPDRMRVDGERVTFTWKLTDCASWYYLSLFDNQGALLYEIGPLDGPAFTLETPLDSGQNYYWSLVPYNQHGSGPPSRKARFETK